MCLESLKHCGSDLLIILRYDGRRERDCYFFQFSAFKSLEPDICVSSKQTMFLRYVLWLCSLWNIMVPSVEWANIVILSWKPDEGIWEKERLKWGLAKKERRKLIITQYALYGILQKSSLYPAGHKIKRARFEQTMTQKLAQVVSHCQCGLMYVLMASVIIHYIPN